VEEQESKKEGKDVTTERGKAATFQDSGKTASSNP
jgi:hypothetical protein